MSDIRGKRPRLHEARVTDLRLTTEERFLVSRIDGRLSVSELAAITGLSEGQVEQIVSKLAHEGALDLEEQSMRSLLAEIDDGGTTSMAEFAAVLGMDPSAFAEAKLEAAPGLPLEPITERTREQPDSEALIRTVLKGPSARPPPPDDSVETLVRTPSGAPPLPDDSVETLVMAAASAEQALREEPLVDDPVDESTLDETPAAGAGPSADENAPEVSAEDAEKDEVSAAAERNYHQLYATRWHVLTVDERTRAAHSATGPDLFALCFDPDPRVIAAILENTTCGLDHVRLIAFHHRTGMGLEVVARRQDWLRDILVERRLLRNPMIGEIVLGRVMGPKRLFATYKITIDRDIPELSRIKCRGYIRQKWQTAASEERADLLLRTEGRCLTLMTGCTFDARTTAILCGRPINSVMFVQSIAKFGSSPPALLAHLMKQPFVRKNIPLRKVLLAHPNMPGDVKRSL
jgi:hypothetical protein